MDDVLVAWPTHVNVFMFRPVISNGLLIWPAATLIEFHELYLRVIYQPVESSRGLKTEYTNLANCNFGTDHITFVGEVFEVYCLILEDLPFSLVDCLLFERLNTMDIVDNRYVSVTTFLEKTLPAHLLLESVRGNANFFKVSPEKIVTVSAVYETIADEQLNDNLFGILGAEGNTLTIAFDDHAVPSQAIPDAFTTNAVVRENSL